MALSYSLEIEAGIEPEVLLLMIAHSSGLEWEGGMLRGAGMTVDAHRQDDFEKSVTEEEFGFRPSVFAGFRISPDEAYEEAIRILMRTTMTLLREVPGDVVLLFNYETMILGRLGNQLRFNEEEPDLHVLSELSDLTEAYENEVALMTA